MIVTASYPLQSSATATVDMASVNTGNQTRDDDLRSDNFFAAAAYPVMTFRSTGIRQHDDAFVVDGELTIPGLASDKVHLDIEAEAVLRKQA